MAKFNILYLKTNLNKDDFLEIFLKDSYIDFFKSSDFDNILKLYQEKNIDLVVVDFTSVKFDIYEFLYDLKKHISFQNILCILDENTKNISNIINLSFDSYLIKPFDSNIIGDCLVSIEDKIKIKKDINIQNDTARRLAHTWRQPLSIISTSASSILVQKEFGVYNELSLTKSLELITKTAQELSVTIELFSKSKKR